MSSKTESTVLLDTILSAAVDAIVIIDRHGGIVQVNPAACAMFGYEAAELTGQPIDMLVPDAPAGMHRDLISEHLITGGGKVVGQARDLDALCKDGSICPVHLSVGRGDVDGAPVFVGIFRDLSARNASQSAMEAAKRMELLGQLTGGVAHDFNNILTIIIGNLELLEQGLAKPQQRILVDEALSAAELGTKLIGKLLAHGRNGHIRPVRLKVNPAITETLKLVERVLSPRTRLRCLFRSSVDHIHIDPAGFENALINLVMNAQDAMPDGGDIVISTSDILIDGYGVEETQLTPGLYVRISITDHGQGMSDEVKEHAFEPFFTTKPSGRGTGLGLATVYGFAVQSGGKVTLYSEVGLGTTVSLYFPVDALDAPALPDEPVASPNAGAANGGLVLVVEDDPAIRKLTVKRIEALGYRAVAVADASEALAKLEQEPDIAAVFSDVVMPGPLNGFDLARKVLSERPDIAVLMTSGFSGDLLQPAGDPLEGLQLLQKPYRQSELASSLRILMSSRVG
ncbi:PAS domain S-box protein [Defluviimonas sp. WL0002]|uniref:histidine kinase n=1 Tax=Albidovulum marisflavi TaxID=2984159 RepID=A0ABT2ZBE4_9RHOB|nr:PAS domain S-box protein [Defluviimonas sp. WL0002]MCV2868401.1 PAS domain S-box protein [Defluviimonas sp. WL0002]